MQNRYVGDIGDFGKYGMLRSLVKGNVNQLVLGINWYLAPDENHNADGKFVQYLDDTTSKNVKEFKSCDKPLYKQLQTLIKNDSRNIGEIENSKLFPKATLFYNELLTFDHLSGTSPSVIAKRKTFRKHWVAAGIQKLADADIVFFDPDDGLEVSSYKPHSKKGVKYVFYHELVDYFRRGQSLIIYNHRDRKPEDEYVQRFHTITDYLSGIGKMFYLRFNRYSVRYYVFVLQPGHVDLVEKEVDQMMQGPWSRHFNKFTMN